MLYSPLMSLFSRMAYRVNQFRQALAGRKAIPDDDILRAHLSPAQAALFRRLQPFEQVHAMRVCESLVARGVADPHLLTAALLHDVGKVLHPLTPFERALIVVGRSIFPRLSCRWSTGQPRGLRRAFVVAAQHPAWGAELAAAAGTSDRACAWIRAHQDDPGPDDPLLAILQAADDQN